MLATVVLATKPSGSMGLLLITMHYPNIIHGEVIVHNVLSRNDPFDARHLV
ncbi:hypothetical protein [Pararhizobium sp. PWRC1-1]|uniref:hypothetical protein n=1 Tax=Pararhizobium sp. PWRC1-1 TaxID=2804566 RepID=UPI003CEF7612